jgi:RHS repeat-associated protein
LKQGQVVVQNLTYNYDNMSRMTELLSNQAVITTYSYDVNSNRLRMVYNNGNSTNYTYNLINKLTTLTNFQNTTVISQENYHYYLNGNIANKSNLNNESNLYLYDGLGRLHAENVILNGNVDQMINYSYDDFSNRSAKNVTGSVYGETSYLYDIGNRLTQEIDTDKGETNYVYDNNGNVTSAVYGSENTLYAYDGYNQLVTVNKDGKTIAYTYNGDGIRTSKQVDGSLTNFLLDGQNVVASVYGQNVTESYLWGINLVAVENTDHLKSYYMHNYHGDVTSLTDSNGNVIKSYSYDAFGNEKNIDANDNNPFRYSGEYFDKETGTIYLRARYYDPQMGRFTSQDSLLGNTNDPLSLNLYTYVQNDPMQYVDPSGHFLETLLDVVSVAWSAVDLVKNPSWGNAGYLTWDVAAAVIPFVPGSYVVKGAKALRNEHLANSFHPVTNVPFNSHGFPVFDAKFEMTLDKSILKSGDTVQFKTATKALAQAIEKNPSLGKQFTAKQLEQIKNGVAKIEGYTWHHNENVGEMQLVDQVIHSKTGHTGGKNIWGGGR